MNDILLSSLPELAKMLQTLTSINALIGISSVRDSASTRAIALSMLKQCQIEIDSIKAVIDLPVDSEGCMRACKASKSTPITPMPSDTLKVCTGACEDCDC